MKSVLATIQWITRYWKNFCSFTGSKGRTSLLILPLLLCSCSIIEDNTNHPQSFSDEIRITKLAHENYKPTDPDNVAVMATIPLERPYKKIGTISINRYNQVGIKRQLGVISDLFQWLCSKIGGQAVIHIQTSGDTISGDVVRYGE